jgi:hypothetical protein
MSGLTEAITTAKTIVGNSMAWLGLRIAADGALWADADFKTKKIHAHYHPDPEGGAFARPFCIVDSKKLTRVSESKDGDGLAAKGTLWIAVEYPNYAALSKDNFIVAFYTFCGWFIEDLTDIYAAATQAGGLNAGTPFDVLNIKAITVAEMAIDFRHSDTGGAPVEYGLLILEVEYGV